MELQTYDAYGRPKSSVQSILGSVVAEAVQGSATPAAALASDVLSLTIEGDGVTPIIIEWSATCNPNTGGTNNYAEVRDASGGGGTVYGTTHHMNYTAGANVFLHGQTVVIPAWTGTKTFYLRITTSAGLITFFGQSAGVRNFMRARRAHVHSLGTDPIKQLGAQVPGGYAFTTSDVTAPTAGTWTAIALFIIAGDGVTPMELYAEVGHGVYAGTGGTYINTRIRDVTAGVTVAEKRTMATAVTTAYAIGPCKGVVAPYTGNKTFSFELTNGSSGTAIAQASGLRQYMRATWAPGYSY